MNKVRRFLAVIALVATLSGLSLQGMGAGLMANTTASQHASAISSTSPAKPVALKLYGPCPTGGDMDC
ncbi:MAG TPA: hypothetical protein VNG51_16140 [Ktedonobacteraceae bacterium]|nr:hypothetical protein [Ktedonobacteraceae bacterium]